MKLNNPNYLNGSRSSAGEIDNRVKECHAGVAHFLNEINKKSRSLGVFVNSDSTGNANGEWVYFFAQYLATNYPEYTVRYRLWNDTSNSYDTAVNINTGTGSYYIDLWNFAVSGSPSYYLLSPNKITNAMLNITSTVTHGATVATNIDLVIINHGHNNWGNGRFVDEVLLNATFTEEMLNVFTKTSVIQMRQNPFRDDNTNTDRIEATKVWANKKEFAIANIWDKFVSLNKSATLYADNIHPSTGLGTEENPTGTRLFLNAVTELLEDKYIPQNIKYFASFTTKIGNAINANSNMTIWTNGDSSAPDGFNVVGGTVVKDTTEYCDIKKGCSTKVVATGGVACYLQINQINGTALTNSGLKGKKIIAAIKCKVSSANTGSTHGRALCKTNLDSSTGKAFSILDGQWHWRFVSCNVDPTSSYIQVTFYVNSASTAVAGEFVNIDKIVLFEGDIPFGG